jgi:hypothetical protein
MTVGVGLLNVNVDYTTDLIIKKMSSISCALRKAKYTLPLATLKVIYFAHVHSIISYGVIFWGNSSGAIKVFKLQKKMELLPILNQEL